MTWRKRAACLNEDPELFFPIGNTGPAFRQIENAKAVCRRREVVDSAAEPSSRPTIWPRWANQVPAGMVPTPRRSNAFCSIWSRNTLATSDTSTSSPNSPTGSSGSSKVRPASGTFRPSVILVVHR